MFRTPSLFEAYRWQVLGFSGFALTVYLIGALLVERRTRLQAEAQARAEVHERERGEQDLRKAFEEMGQLSRPARSGQQLSH